MPRSAAEERTGDNKFLKWRSKKKDFLVAYASNNERRAWKALRSLMLFTNRNLKQIKQDRRKVDENDYAYEL